jgi:hypothetical protein
LPEDDGQSTITQPQELLVQLLGHQVKGLAWLKGTIFPFEMKKILFVDDDC